MRHVLLHGGHYAAVVALCLAAIGPLARGRWLWRVPRVGVVLWQTLALSVLLSLVGLCLAIGLAPYGRGEALALAQLVAAVVTGAPTGLTAAQLVAVAVGLSMAAAVAVVVLRHLVTVTRLRSRHRWLLSLVADPDPADPALLRVDHPAAAAYCLPGRRGAVVVTAGAVDRLHPDQLAAVLDHEHSHARERHDLVLLPFAALHRALPRWSYLARAYAAVALMVEMRADDRALRRHSADALAAALRAVSAAGAGRVPDGALGAAGAGRVPDGALGAADGAADGQVGARLHRIAHPPRPRRLVTAFALAAAVTLAATPVSLYLLP